MQWFHVSALPSGFWQLLQITLCASDAGVVLHSWDIYIYTHTFFSSILVFWWLWFILLYLTFRISKIRLKSSLCFQIYTWRMLCKPICYLGYISTTNWVALEGVCSPGCCTYMLQGRIVWSSSSLAHKTLQGLPRIEPGFVYFPL